MYCTNCGLQLPNEALFCAECGTRQRSREERSQAPRLPSQAPPVAPASPEPVWEYCEIIWAKMSLSVKEFHAVASGPYGSKVVEKVMAWRDDSDPDNANRKSVANLVKKLTKKGWEPQPMGSEWYAHRFRRKVS